MSHANEKELFEKIERQLYSPVISDSLDSLGFRNCAMSYRIRPLREDFVFAGRARTVVWMDVFAPDPNPYQIEIEFMDKLKPGDVVVTNTDAPLRNAPWGELMSTAAKARGARAAVIDSCVRDVKKIFELNFSVFATAISPLDSNGRGRVVAYDVPVQCGEVLVNTGDLIMGDYDGVVVVPKKIENQVLELAFDKAMKEKKTKQELLEGKLLREVYDKYGVL
jgi:4-hydroxy-4-methyl-2-oxoglutarate aldolase